MEQAEIRQIKQRVESLTPREHEVLVLVTAGMLNKQIAYDLKLSENTIKTHRAHIMQKMKAESLADLVRLTEMVDICRHKG
jgi:FixJ family two-component response regulator